MKQRGRIDLLQIRVFSHLEDIFSMGAIYLFGDTRSEAKKMESGEKIVFVTGPEKEIKLLEKHGTGVSLHKNILRAETAPIAATCFNK